VAQLSIVWSDITDVELEIGTLETHVETAQTAPVSEPTLALTMEARLDGDSATIALLLPHTAIAPVAHRFSSRDHAHAGSDAREASAVRNALGGVAMALRAEVASVEVPIEQVVALRPGDILPLGGRAEDGVTIYADSVPVHRAQPGRSGGRRAVQITGRLGGPA
jgi:flagellar motor switch protein FliM